MRTYSWLPFLLAAGLHLQAAVQIVPARIEEVRTLILVDDKVSRTPPSLKLTLSLSGPEAESAVRYGNLKLEEAVDDKGTSLIPTNDTFHDAAKFKDYSNAFFRKSSFGGKSDPQVELHLALAPRQATTLTRLRGTLDLAEQGTLQTIELAALKGGGKKVLPVPPNAGVGITATLASSDAVRSIAVEITGDESVIESLEVVDASGRKITDGMSSWSINGGPVKKTLSLRQPLDDSMKLVAKLALNRKVTKVPFDLKDIKLP
jgi:hypothetical protein